jgi:hypothetical protein
MTNHPRKATSLETPNSGIAPLDYDNEDWLDFYLLDGSTGAATQGLEPAPRAMLLRHSHGRTLNSGSS